jgi:CRP-like cAMP-binding protein
VPASVLFHALEPVAQPVTLRAGEVLFRRGDAPSAVFHIHSGRVVLVWSGRKKVYPMDVLGPGAIVGLPAAFSGICRVTARTVEPCVISVIPCRLLMDRLRGDPNLLRAATALLGQDVARARRLLSLRRRPGLAQPRDPIAGSAADTAAQA